MLKEIKKTNKQIHFIKPIRSFISKRGTIKKAHAYTICVDSFPLSKQIN
jgi:hypothetical protein